VGQGVPYGGHRDKARLKAAAPAVDNQDEEGEVHAIVWFVLGVFCGGLAGVMIAALGAAAARGDEEWLARHLVAGGAPFAPEGVRAARAG
jgi:type IV secretory pathway VirB2 component (pilin)